MPMTTQTHTYIRVRITEQCQRPDCTCSGNAWQHLTDWDNSSGQMVQLRHSLAMKQCLPLYTHAFLFFFQDSHSYRIMPLCREKKGRHPGLRSMGNLLAVRVSHSSDCWINGTIKARGVFVLSAKKLGADFPLTWSIPLHNVQRKKKQKRNARELYDVTLCAWIPLSAQLVHK